MRYLTILILLFTIPICSSLEGYISFGDNVQVYVLRVNHNNFIQIEEHFNINEELFTSKNISENNNYIEAPKKTNYYLIIIITLFILIILIFSYLFFILYTQKLKWGIWLIIFSLILILSYIYFINYLSNLTNSSINLLPNEDSYNGNLKIALSDNLNVIVVRNRWYGKIVEYDGRSYYNPFNLIKIPLNKYIYFHLLFLIILIILIITFERRKNKNEKYSKAYFNNF